MNNEIIIEKSLWKRSWKWLLPTIMIMLFFLVRLFLNSNIDGSLTDIAKAYSDNLLYEKAIEKANKNKRVLEVIGQIKPIDKLAILEGNAYYSNNNNSIILSVRIKGSKGKGKMNISADKNGSEWVYKKINIRIKEPKEEIQIVFDSIGQN